MVKRLLFILLFSVFAYTGFGQGFAQEQARTRSIPYIKNTDISISGYLVWHGDTIDFTDLIDSMVLRVGDSTKYVTPTALKDTIAGLAGGHDPLTLDENGTLAGMYLNEQVLGMLQAGSAQNGYLSWEDWVHFNSKLSWVYHDSTLIGEGTFTNPLRVDTTRLTTNFDNTGDWQGTWFGHDTAYFITVIEDDAFSAAWDGDLDGASKNSIYDYLNSLSFNVTDLSYTATPTYVTVHSSNGDDTNLPLATQTNAGLMAPGDKAKLDTLRYPIDTIFVTPDNTFPIEYLKYTANGEEIAITDIPKPDGLYSGGIVTWQTGLTFAVGPAAYYIDGTLYTSSSTTLTLTAADGTNSRIDLFVVDTLGTVSYITGTPSINPQTPQYDLSSQLPLTSVLILANATEPINPGGDTLLTEVVYNENVEWTAGYSGVVTDFNQTTIVQAGSIAAESNTTGYNDYIYFVSDADVNTGTYETFSFWIRLKEALWGKDNFVIQFLWNSTAVSIPFPIDFDITSTSWQIVSIDLADVNITSNYFDEIRLIYDPFKTTNTFSGFYTDYVILQGGISVPLTVGDDWGDQVAQTDETINGDGTIGNELKVDTALIATKTDIDTLSTNLRDSLLVHRTEIEAIKDSITEHRTELENVKDSITIHRTEIENIKDSLLVHREDIHNNIDSLIIHRAELDSIYTVLSDHDSMFIDLYDSITQVNIEINNLFDSITVINTDISNLYDSITNLNNHITNIFDSLTVVNVDIENLYDSITEINIELTNLWDTVIQNSYDIDNILDSLTVINNRIENIDLNVEGDNWGTQTAQTDETINGDGTEGNELGVDTTIIATKHDIDTLSQTVQQIDSTLNAFEDTDDQTAIEVPYDNGTSGLTATEVQNAIDELDNTVDGIIATGGDNWGTDTVVHDNTLTGPGTFGDPLKVDTSLIATQNYVQTTINNNTNIQFDTTLTSSGAYSGITTILTVGENVVLGDFLYINFSTGKLMKASSDAYATTPAQYMALESITANSTGSVLIEGFVRVDTWSWGAAKIFLSTSGTGTSTTPSSGFVQVLGIAKTSSVMYFRPSYDVGEI